MIRWAGFSTGEWDGDQLVITTTHVKDGVIRRSGAPASPETVLTRGGAATTDPEYQSRVQELLREMEAAGGDAR